MTIHEYVARQNDNKIDAEISKVYGSVYNSMSILMELMPIMDAIDAIKNAVIDGIKDAINDGIKDAINE